MALSMVILLQPPECWDYDGLVCTTVPGFSKIYFSSLLLIKFCVGIYSSEIFLFAAYSNKYTLNLTIDI